MHSFKVLFLLAALFGSLLANKPCENLLPGLERMSRGVDITSLELFPYDISLTNGFRQSLFDFSCNSDLKWSHPSRPDLKYIIPDQVSSINSIPGGVYNQKTTFNQHLRDYKKSLSIQLGLDAPTGIYGDYSLSFGYKKFQETILASNQTTAEISAFLSATQMDFKPHTSLTPNDNFNQFVTNQLTGKYNDMPEKYQEFLDTFGTHYFESGIFGGYLLQQTVINDNYRYTTRDSEINANLNAKYQSLVNGHFDVDNNSNNRTAIFNQNTQTSRFFYGGQTNLLTNMDEKQFALWAASVPNDPWLFGGKIMPIETLISCDKVKAEVKSAVVIKRHKAYLQELKETLMLVSKTIPRAFNEVNKITELLKQTDPKEADIEQLAHMVQEYVADAQAVKDRYQMKHYVDELSKLQSYELFCKQEVALKCDKEKKHDIEEAVAEVTHLQTSMANMIVSQSRPDTEQVRLLVARSNELVKYHQTTPMSDCREKLICKMCKSALINITDKETCNTEHIKKLVQVHT